MKINFLGYFLSFTQFIQCFNETINQAVVSVYSNETNRVKRVAEYTRWRVDPKSTKEFLVKVLDDDSLRSTPKITHAINVNQDAKMLPLDMAHMHTFRSKSPSKTLDDYTRFMVPTTVHTATSKQSYFDEFALKAQKPLRDESPPSGPEFIERANPVPRVQVAPLAPIAFPRRTAYEAPLTPPTGPRQYHTGSMSEKTSNSNLMLPSRTTPLAEYFSNFIYDDSHDVDSKRRPLIQGSSYNSYRTPSMETLTTDLIRTASLEPVALARTSVGQEKDFYFRRLHVDDENNNQRAAQAAERKSIINSLTSPPKHINNQQIPEHKHRAESSPKDYDSNYNAVHESDDYSTSKKNDLDEDLGIGSSEERDAKMNEDSSSEDANDDFVLLDDIKARAPHRTTETFLINTVPPRTTTVKLDYDSVEVYYEETDNTTIEKMNATEYQKIEGPTQPKRRMLCDLSNQPKHKHETFPKTLSEINEQLRRWAGPSPIAKLMDITNGNFTIMENPIYLVTVDDPSSGQAVMAKQTVMIVAGIGARDHHAVAAAMELLRKLLEDTDDHAELLSKHRFLVIPVFNPDGYEYSIGLPHRRNWVKNLRQYWDECTRGRGCEACQSHGLRCTLKPCYGVNLDRNFEYQWIPNEELEAEHPCGPLYAGERQLSEPETRALANFLHKLDPPLYAFITFKEGEVLGVMYPYSHTKNKRLFDHTYRKNATRAAIAASSVMGRSFVAGQTSEFLPLYAGGMEDWVDGHLGIDRVYSVLVFRPADNLNKQLAHSADNFQKVGQEAFSAVVRLLLPTPGDLMSAPGSLPVIMSRNQPDQAHDAAPQATHTTVLLILAIICLELNKSYAY